MPDHPVLWIVLCAILSLGLVWFQYFFKPKQVRFRVLLAALRFLALMGMLLLLINPRVTETRTYLEKHRLVLLLDNSASIKEDARQQVRDIRTAFGLGPEFETRFDRDVYTFGGELSLSDSLDFSANRTDISAALDRLDNTLSTENASIVLVTDGNENSGRSYLHARERSAAVYPVVVGDTTRYRDVRVDQLNVNRFAFLDNQFPVEILLSYSGREPVSAILTLSDNGRRVHRETLTLEPGNSTRQLEILLQAGSVGFHRLEATVAPLPSERNTANNRRLAGLEVVDERTRILLVFTRNHPDIGALRRSILKNEQREVALVSPEEAQDQLDEADLLVLFQPDTRFKKLYEALRQRDIPQITLAGPLTDWGFLNTAQNSYELEEMGPYDEMLPLRNAAFDFFDLSDWDVSEYPPLEGRLGNLLIAADNQTLLGQRVRGIDMQEPLLAYIKGSRREILFMGSGIWKWRMAAYREAGNFEGFDAFMAKTLLFLTAGGSSKRLSLEYQPLYEDSGNALIRARYYDESFVFDPDARLVLQLADSTGRALEPRPMALRTDYFEADVTGLPPGTYQFTVRAGDSGFSESGAFSLLAFDLESQQLSSDARKLGQLAGQSGGTLYFPGTTGALRDSLLNSDRFRPVQKSRRNVVSLIDYHWLLFGIALCLAAEWFIRKYNGLL
ncbi:VWA domain-containing protein [Robiginitalea sp. SC105]|uniref:VWA domain-containing protein n=1 Tax=Robiginitalea sp. SC105 TaxID=2762332 RepID=UPI001639A057|nr:VWA domain-containing protein [Robiginitalea sp. SC105]MBC2840605.1 VWA domain-containing protein [Robiginitalea sp. SC105]